MPLPKATFISLVLALGSGCFDLSPDHYVFDASAPFDAGLVNSAGCPRVCASPPATHCVDSTTLEAFPTNGQCTANNGCGYNPVLVQCSQSCVAGHCAGEPCAGVFCDRPPPLLCEDSTHARVFDVSGTCNAGSCTYESHIEDCPGGCANGVCGGQQCDPKRCTRPGAASCVDANTLRRFVSPGTCFGNACSYAAVDLSCANGCASDVCVGDPCATKVCASPPTDVCVSARKRRTFLSTGVCGAGVCSYSSLEIDCAENESCVAGQCRKVSVACNVASCPTGCCQGEVCVSPAMQSNAQCGQGASACGACGSGALCTSGTCEDIDECASANGGCDVHAMCTNTAGSRSCACGSGYDGDGFTCVLKPADGGGSPDSGAMPDGGLMPDAGGADAGSADAGGAAAAFCNAMATRYCSTALDAGQLEGVHFEDCKSFYLSGPCFGVSSAEAGFRRFSQSMAAACLKMPTRFSEVSDWSDSALCAYFSFPQGGLGDRCLTNPDCGGALVCDGLACGLTTCREAGALDQPCFDSGRCDGNLSCDLATNRCKAPRALGQTCRSDASGYNRDECAAGLTCLAATHTCVALRLEGETCTKSSDCTSGFDCLSASLTCARKAVAGQSCALTRTCDDASYCDGSVCRARIANGQACGNWPPCMLGLTCRSGTCQPPANVNEFCNSSLECTANNVFPTLYCSGAHVCRPKALTAPCESDSCPPSHFCDLVLKTCERYTHAPVVGESCTLSTSCATPLGCIGVWENPDGGIGSAGTCQELEIDGLCGENTQCPATSRCDVPSNRCRVTLPQSTCGRSTECPENYACVTGKCQPSSRPGQPCTYTDECVANASCTASLLDGGTSVSSTCQLRRPVGASCARKEECQFPEECQAGRCVPAGHLGESCFELTCFDGACRTTTPTELGLCFGMSANNQVCERSRDCASGDCLGALFIPGICRDTCP